jgi:hypothetical protein
MSDKTFDNEWNQIIEIELNKLHKKNGLNPDCIISIVADDTLSITKGGEAVDLFILPGNPPKLYVTWLFIGRCFLLKRTNPALFRQRLERAMERFPMMRKNLLNNIRSDVALVLRKDMTRWLKTRMEVIDPILPDDNFEVSYCVTVTEKETGIKVTYHYTDTKQGLLKAYEAKQRLSAIVLKNDEMLRFKEMLREMKDDSNKLAQVVKESSVEKITLVSLENDNLKEVREYKE